MIQLRTKNLKKYYQRGPHLIKALDGIDLEVERGCFLAVMGISGSGKSTLLHLLGGLDEPTEGRVQIGEVVLDHLDEEEKSVFRRRKIGFIFQNYNLAPMLNIYENIVFPLTLDGRKPDEELLRSIISFLRLEDLLDAFPGELSGGQQQRAAIARALIAKPPVVLADEPTGALDSQTGHMIMDIFHKLHEEQGKTVVLITHSKELAAETERIVTLNDGMIVSDSKKTEKGCDLSGHHKMNDGCNKPEIGEEGRIC